MANSKPKLVSMIGRTVTVEITKPYGSDFPGAGFPVNYGSLTESVGEAKTPVHAYIYGIHKPIHRFKGQVIGVAERQNGPEDILIVSRRGTIALPHEVEEQVGAVEKQTGYEIKYRCMYETSCGMVPFRVVDGVPQYLILYQKGSHTWSFPKGHMESGEDECMTARREVEEETGLHLHVLDGFREEVHYTIGRVIRKKVILFLAQAEDHVRMQPSEIENYRWVSREEAAGCLIMSDYRALLDHAEATVRRFCHLPPENRGK